MSHSILQLFPGLESAIREFVPRCAFYFGEDDVNREAQPPKIIWDVDGGDPSPPFERQNAVQGMVSPKAFSADAVQIVATVMGAAQPAAEATEREPHAQDFAATEHLMLCLRWALKKSDSRGALGKHKWHGWTNVTPSLTERGCIFECRFEITEQVIAPEPLISSPPHELITSSITLET